MMTYRGTYSIRDLEALSGIRAHTIRIWEKRYRILTPGRSETNIREYSNDDLRLLLNISLLTRHGHKISKIAGMTAGQRTDLLMGLDLEASPDSDLEDSLVAGMIAMDEERICRVFNAAVASRGFEAAVQEIVFPFFSRIGMMWQIGSVNPAQEHFVSNLFRQKFLAAIDTRPAPVPGLSPKIVLFLPGNEQHELTLLFYHYALRSRGFATVYLGQGVPVDSLHRIIGITQADVLLGTLTTSLAAPELDQLVLSIHESFPSGNILLSGPAVRDYGGDLPRNVAVFPDLTGLLDLLQQQS